MDGERYCYGCGRWRRACAFDEGSTCCGVCKEKIKDRRRNASQKSRHTRAAKQYREGNVPPFAR